MSSDSDNHGGPVVAREDASLMPDFLGISVLGAMAYISVCVLMFTTTMAALTFTSLGVVPILLILAGLVVVESLVGAALLTLSAISPNYRQTPAFVQHRLRTRYGQTRVRYDELAPRSYPNFKHFDPDADGDEDSSEDVEHDNRTDHNYSRRPAN